MSIDLSNFDLNRLRAFVAILQEGSLVGAGERLRVTQSAMSHSLARLRQDFGDPLFVRTTGGMRPTPYASQLAGAIVNGLELIERGLQSHADFNCLTSTRVFRILTTDIAELVFFPKLMDALQIAAPGVGLRSMPAHRPRYREALESGSADLAIGRLPAGQHDFHQQHLLDMPVVCMMRSNHPVIQGRLTMKQFLEASQLTVSEPAQLEGMVRRALGKRAGQRRIALDVTHYAVVPAILAQSDLIAVMPLLQTPDRLALLGLKALSLPFKVPSIQVLQFWHERSHADPGHQWVRRLIAERCMA